MRRRWVLLPVITTALITGFSDSAQADIHLLPNPNGPLAGKTIVFSPGHGYLLDNGTWRFQRGIVHTLREDIHTNEIFIQYVQRYLLNAGAQVESCRERSFQRHEVIVDNGGPGYRETGSWTSSTSAPHYYGTGYRYARVAGPSASATATFTPTIPEAGRYPVYAWWTPSGNRATDATFVIHHAGGATAVTVNMQHKGDHWRFLGEFFFAAGTAGKVVLSNAGADPTLNVIADAVRFGGGVGASGKDRWREAAHEFLPYKGFQSTRGDVTIRPVYGTWLAGGDTTRWRDDFLYLALHSNASSGAARGLSTFSYSNGRTPAWGSAGAVTYPTVPSPLSAASDAFRDVLHREVLAAVRADFEPSWPDRGGQRMNFGELRESRCMPSALIELGFHDNVDDAALLASSRFRALAARAIYKGVVKYWAPGTPIIPLPPRGVRVENLGGGRVRVAWTRVLDPLEPSAAPSGYVVYVSRDGRGFDDGRAASGTELVLDGLTPGQPVFVRVAATNGGGESLPTRVCGGRVGDPARRLLLVDGFDRAFTHTEANIAARFTWSYAVEHVAALSVAAPTAAIDYASHEAVIAGDVQLASYPLVDWLLGRESSLDRTFDPDEQRLVGAYLAGGGALIATGTEIGWDLGARGGGTTFLNDVLGARYVRDDAGVRTARAAPQSAFAGLPLLALSDGSRSYEAAYPDVLAPTAGGEVVVAYEAAGAPAAGVARRSPTKVVVLGFPLEAVTDAAARAALATEAVRYLLPQGLGGGSTSTGGGASSTSGTGGSASTGGGTGGTTGSAPTPTGSGGGTTAAPSTAAASAPPAGGGGGGCSLAPTAAGGAPAGAAWALLLLALLGLRRRGSSSPGNSKLHDPLS